VVRGGVPKCGIYRKKRYRIEFTEMKEYIGEDSL
jgi:hypothetical protein